MQKYKTPTVLSVDLVIWSTKVKQDISLLITDTVMILILGQIVWANNADPDQTALRGALRSGQHCLLFNLHLFDRITLKDHALTKILINPVCKYPSE